MYYWEQMLDFIERKEAATELGFITGRLTREAAIYGALAGAGAAALKMAKVIPSGCIVAAVAVGGIFGSIVGANSVGQRLRSDPGYQTKSNAAVGR